MLVDFIKFAVEVLSIALGYKYSSQIIFCKTGFGMSDSTYHNCNIVEQVFGDEGIKENAKIPLLCNVHPVMVFQKKIKELGQDIHDIIS